jgi:hypothetical protein
MSADSTTASIAVRKGEGEEMGVRNLSEDKLEEGGSELEVLDLGLARNRYMNNANFNGLKAKVS